MEQSAQKAPGLIDYAVMTGALLVSYEGTDPYMHAQMFRYLDDGAVVLGENATLGEYRTLQTLSAVNACYLPASGVCNLSTMSGLARDGVSLSSMLPDISSAGEQPESGKHTVCLVLSDGQSLRWMTDDFLTSSSWFGSEKRGRFAINWGIPATLGELANPILTSIASRKAGTDEFIVQYSGVGATLPSLWHEDALSAMAQKLGTLMDAMGVSYMQVLDDAQMSVDKVTPFAMQDAVKGIFWADYNYENLNGAIYWVEDTPIMQARYRLCAELHTGSLEYIAESINAASTDASEEGAYSVIVIDASSGLDAQGYLIPGGNTMDAVAALIAALDENVEVVGAQTFVARIKANLAPTLQNDDNSGK